MQVGKLLWGRNLWHFKSFKSLGVCFSTLCLQLLSDYITRNLIFSMPRTGHWHWPSSLPQLWWALPVGQWHPQPPGWCSAAGPLTVPVRVDTGWMRSWRGVRSWGGSVISVLVKIIEDFIDLSYALWLFCLQCYIALYSISLAFLSFLSVCFSGLSLLSWM